MSGLASVAPGVLRLETTVTRHPHAVGAPPRRMRRGRLAVDRHGLRGHDARRWRCRRRGPAHRGPHPHRGHQPCPRRPLRRQRRTRPGAAGLPHLVHRDDAAWASDPAWHVRDAYGALDDDYPCPAEVKAWVAAPARAPAPVERLEAGDRRRARRGRELRVLHLPGHSPGHLGLWDAEHGTPVARRRPARRRSAHRRRGRGDPLVPRRRRLPRQRSGRSAPSTPRARCRRTSRSWTARALRDFCDRSRGLRRGLEEAIVGLLADRRPRALRTITERVVPAVAPASRRRAWSPA
jgi:hypothetical protein